MTNRREFLQGAALTALPVAAGATVVPASAPAPLVRVALHGVLIDARHVESRHFGARLKARGAPVHNVPDGDVTQLWQRQIRPLWAQGAAAIAGLTGRPVLFCLEQLAWSYGLRVVFHAEHVLHPEAATEHVVLRGGAAAGLAAQDLPRFGAVWPEQLADAIATHREQAVCVREGPSCAGLEPPLQSGSQLLTSWIIAAA